MQTRTNQLQMPTWRWLGINSAPFPTLPDHHFNKTPALSNTDGFTLTNAPLPAVDLLSPDQSASFDFTVEHAGQTLTVIIPDGKQFEAPLMIDYELDAANPCLIETLHIIAGENSQATIAVRYHATGDAPCFHGGFTLVSAASGSNITVVKAQLLAAQDTHLDAIAAIVQDNASVDFVLCELGSQNTTVSSDTHLLGHASKSNLYGLYTGTGNKVMDMNYRTGFSGRETEGEIFIRGALAGKAKKVLKSTIDFISGAQAAKGREEEVVLALSDEAINLSTPLLLCGEENVEGAHSTNTGKPDPQKLFYLMNRGLSEAAAKLLLVEASFAPILDRIQPDLLREEVIAHIQEVVHGA